MSPEPWGYGLLTVRQGDLQFSQVLGGEIYTAGVADMLREAADHMDAWLEHLAGHLEADRAWTFWPNRVYDVERSK